MSCVGEPTILVVDDEEAIAEAVRARLESEGYRVVTAPDQIGRASCRERVSVVV